MNRRTIAALLVFVVFAAGGAVPAIRADTIAIIGTGNVGGALGQRFAELGHTVVYGSRDPARADVVELVGRTGANARAATQPAAAEGADVVVLALPWEVVEQVTGELGALNGVIVIDPTNPRTTGPDGLRDYLVTGIGFAPMDVGPLRFARVIEGLHFLRYNAGQVGGARFNYHLRPEVVE